MTRELQFRNRQRVRRINLRLLGEIAETTLRELAAAGEYELCIHIVTAKEMTRLNETYLRHVGSTDVITFDHTDAQGRASSIRGNALRSKRGVRDVRPGLHGEIFVCVEEAISQARRFRTSWQSEIVRYIVHGVLHLAGYEDLHARSRMKMKKEENRLMRRLTRRFALSKL